MPSKVSYTFYLKHPIFHPLSEIESYGNYCLFLEQRLVSPGAGRVWGEQFFIQYISETNNKAQSFNKDHLCHWVFSQSSQSMTFIPFNKCSKKTEGNKHLPTKKAGQIATGNVTYSL